MSENTTDGNKAEPRRKVGDILRDARIVRDEELKEVAKALAIRLPFMEAIEESRPNDLPGAAYALGFVRSYAGYLGMDSKALVERYKDEAKELELETALHFPEPLPSRKVPIGALLFIGIILVLLFYGVWWYLNNQGKNLADIVPALSSEQTEMAQATTPEEPAEIIQETTAIPEEATTAIEETVAVAEPLAEQTVEVVETAVVETTTALATEAADQTVSEANEVAEDTIAVIEETTAEVTEVIQKTEEAVATEIPATVDEAPTVVEAANADTTTTIIEPTETVTAPTSTLPTEIVEDTEAAVEEVVAEAVEEVTEEAEEAAVLVEKVVEVTNTPAVEANTSSIVDTAEVPTVVTPLSDERKERVYGEENTNSRVTILAKESAWVEVSDASGELTLTRLLRKGDRYLVPNKPGLSMVTGNAGGIYILVDGTEIGASGPIGAVRRDYSLDADKLLAPQTSENTSNTSN